MISVLLDYSLSYTEKSTCATVCFICESRKAAFTVIYLNALFCFSFRTQTWLLSLYQSQPQKETDGTRKLG